MLFPADGSAPSQASVADALMAAQGGRIAPKDERRHHATVNNLIRIGRDQRFSVFSHFEDDVREFAILKGWISA
jgi:hypothetical protein